MSHVNKKIGMYKIERFGKIHSLRMHNNVQAKLITLALLGKICITCKNVL